MTGEALYGPLAGTRLQLENVLHGTVAQVLREDPKALVAISDHPSAIAQRPTAPPEPTSWLSRLLSFRDFGPRFQGTIREEDDRRPTMELGIGIWNGSEARYYPMEAVEEQSRALLDTFRGRKVLIFYDPTGYTLSAQYTTAESVWWEDDVLRFSTGERIENGIRFAEDGSRVKVERPLQLFTRWYGFALTFPGTEIYGEG